jgi:hypothetical protein
MGRAYSTHGGCEKCSRKFQTTSRKEMNSDFTERGCDDVG